ncbi:MAG: hypothetical protein RL220_1118, partial [Bacteroidota bacterium]
KEIHAVPAVSAGAVELNSVVITSRSGNKRVKSRSNAPSRGSRLGLDMPANEEEVAQIGLLTAGEINDFGKWNMWDDVAKGDLDIYRARWQMYPAKRYCAIVQNDMGAPVPDANVEMLDEAGRAIWTARTDNTGKAELWSNFFMGEEQDKPASLVVTMGNLMAKKNDVVSIEKGVNAITIGAACGISDQVDIMFAVDATASMGDEIEYLKMELTDIINQVSSSRPELSIRTGSLFYKCPGNSYVTKPQSFTSDIATTVNFISQQSASEGGDEVVEQAMLEAVNQFEWSSEARARLLFMVLDEPPGLNSNVIPDLQLAIKEAAKKGIRIIPLVSSGVTYEIDKSLEYLMRCVALGTNGSYTFLTNHSGIGNPHTAPSTDSYDVEKLNGMLIRLIDQYTYFPDCPAPEIAQTATPVESDTTLAEAGEGKRKWQMELFPNPARFEINIRSEKSMDEIHILDMSGKLIYRFALAEELFNLQLESLTNGNYIARCRTGEEWTSLKFVVSK